MPPLAQGGTSRRLMPWIAASLISALFLGCYELSTKHVVRDNAVLPVLFLANVCSASVWGLCLALAALAPAALPASLVVAHLDGEPFASVSSLLECGASITLLKPCHISLMSATCRKTANHRCLLSCRFSTGLRRHRFATSQRAGSAVELRFIRVVPVLK